MKKYSLSQKLFRSFVGWFIVYMIILMGISIMIMAVTIYRNIENTQKQLIVSMNENIQNYFDDMDSFSMELSNSLLFKTTAVKELPDAYKSGKSTAELFSTLYQEAYRMIQKDYNVGILVDNQYYIWMGRNYFISSVNGSEIHTYDKLVRDETPVIKYLERNEYLQSAEKEMAEEEYITLSRSMSLNRPFLNGKEILEIQVEKQSFINDITEMLGKRENRNVNIHIYDSDGIGFYGESDLNLKKYVQNDKEEIYRDQGNIITVEKIFDDKLTVIYTIDLATYYKRMSQFWVIAIIAGMCIIAIVVMKSYRVSKETSKPIHEICEHVKKMNLTEGVGYEHVETDIDEIDFLSRSLCDMSKNLGNSLQQIIAMKDYEIHAKMLALQAQMQPHFLFNTLMTISSLAQDDGNTQIANICTNLTSMFRYISADAGDGVGIFEEIQHLEHYVEIMKERFPESKVEIDIPLEIMEERIPKLTIQPLVENAFKYCNRQKPEIEIHGSVDSAGSWQITVSDNGNGFSPEDRKKILQKCDESLQNEKILSNQIDGMGLVNVYVRLKLFYQEDMIYKIDEHEGKITIGRFRHLHAEQK